jgi:carboxymethylenebutenolidase
MPLACLPVELAGRNRMWRKMVIDGSIAPTGRAAEVPMVAIVKFVGDKVAHEHIYWVRASVLVQVGLFAPRGLPVAGAEQAHKLSDESLPSNTLMARWRKSEGK